MNAKIANLQIVSSIDKLINNSKGRVTIPDLAAATGYKIDEISDAMAVMIERYRCKVNADMENGTVRFEFLYPLVERKSKSWQEYAYLILEKLWEVFKIVYKASIGIILIIYAVIFVLIILAVVFGASKGDNDRRSSNIDVGRILSGVFSAIFDAFRIYYYAKSFEYITDNDGFRYKKVKKEENKGKGFIMSVYSFVFGPERTIQDINEDAKEVAEYIRTVKNRITATDIVALSGANFQQADEKMAEYSARFKGDLDISNDAVLFAEFNNLDKGNSQIDGGRIIYYWNETEEPYQITGNSAGRNAAIIAVNSFNLIMSLIIMSEMSNMGGAGIFLGLFPFLFSILFFVIPIFRSINVKKKEKNRKLNKIRKKLVKCIIDVKGQGLAPQQYMDYANIHQEEYKDASNVLENLIKELNADVNLSNSGQPSISFPRIEKELSFR